LKNNVFIGKLEEADLTYRYMQRWGVFIMSSKSDNEFRKQLRDLVFEFEKKGVSLQMIIDYVNSLKK